MSLNQVDPATVFISYARADEELVLPFERALQERGVRVLRDKPSLNLGAHNVRDLTELIDFQCDVILFYITNHFLDSYFIWRYEVPAALARHRREGSFHIIPVLDGIAFDELSVHCSDRGLPSLADFNAERVTLKPVSSSEVRRMTCRILRSALAQRRARSGSITEPTTICLHTFPYTPPTSNLYLDVDWTLAFSDTGLSPDDWIQNLLPALADMRDALAQQARPNEVDVWMKAHLPAALALGSVFPPKGSLRLRLCTEDRIWACYGPGEDASDLNITRTLIKSQEHSAIVEIAVSRETAEAVTTWRKGVQLVPKWRIHCAPSTGPSRSALTNESQARAWARCIGNELRRLWDVEGVKEVHLFVSSPVEFAVLIGQQLDARHRVHVYYGNNDAGYLSAFTLSGKSE